MVFGLVDMYEWGTDMPGPFLYWLPHIRAIGAVLEPRLWHQVEDCLFPCTLASLHSLLLPLIEMLWPKFQSNLSPHLAVSWMFSHPDLGPDKRANLSSFLALIDKPQAAVDVIWTSFENF